MYHHHRHHCHKDNDSGIGCLVMLLLGFLALPFIGFYLLLKDNPEDKALGVFLMIVGIVIWVVIAV